VLVATNKNLEEEVAAGRFRHDLFYRLNVFAIRLPPLRERREDVPLLIEHFLRHFSRSLGRDAHTVTTEALACLLAYDWPGNVRQLQNVLKYAFIQATGGVVTLDCLPENLRPNAAAPVGAPPDVRQLEINSFTTSLLHAGEPDIYRRVSAEMDRVLLEAVLRHAKGNQVQASELLGISRTTLRAKLRALGITFEKQLLSGESDPLG
jgi:DNA-binding NtrC family response regulator